jgi:Spy/CpxP family protein refolding chaperone
MKKLSIILAITLLLAATGAWAQDAPKRERNVPAGRTLGIFGLPPQLGDKLKLTDEQKLKVTEVAKKYRPQLEEIRKQMMEEFRGILTDEQKKTLDDTIERMRKRTPPARGEGGERKPDGNERKPDGGDKQ